MSKPPKAPIICLKELAHLSGVGDIGGMAENLTATALKAADGAIHGFPRAAANGHRRSFAEQALGNGAPDAVRSAGNHGNFSC